MVSSIDTNSTVAEESFETTRPIRRINAQLQPVTLSRSTVTGIKQGLILTGTEWEDLPVDEVVLVDGQELSIFNMNWVVSQEMVDGRPVKVLVNNRKSASAAATVSSGDANAAWIAELTGGNANGQPINLFMEVMENVEEKVLKAQDELTNTNAGFDFEVTPTAQGPILNPETVADSIIHDVHNFGVQLQSENTIYQYVSQQWRKHPNKSLDEVIRGNPDLEFVLRQELKRQKRLCRGNITEIWGSK